MILYEYSKLKDCIVEKYGTTKAFADAIGWSKRKLALKLNDRANWHTYEIKKAVELLQIADADISDLFFSIKGQ